MTTSTRAAAARLALLRQLKQEVFDVAVGIQLGADPTTLVNARIAAAPDAALAAATAAWLGTSGVLEQLHPQDALSPAASDGCFPVLRANAAFHGISLRVLAMSVSFQAKRGDSEAKIQAVLTLAALMAEILEVVDQCEIPAPELAAALSDSFNDRNRMLRPCRSAHGC